MVICCAPQMYQSELQPLNKRTYSIMEHDQYLNGSTQAKIQILGPVSSSSSSDTQPAPRGASLNHIKTESVSYKQALNTNSSSATGTSEPSTTTITATSAVTGTSPPKGANAGNTSRNAVSGPETFVQNAEVSMFSDPHYIVLLHLVTSGKQGEDFGIDETPIVCLTYAMYDVENKRVVDMHSWFVNPANPNEVENMESSSREGDTVVYEECQQATGITDNDLLQRGLSLEETLLQMDKHLRAHAEQNPHKRYCVATFGQHALRLVLHHEATAKNINLHPFPYLFAFFDLKKAYLRVTPSAVATSPTPYTTDASSVVSNGTAHVTWEELRKNFQGHLDEKSDYGLNEVWKLSDLVGELLSKGHRFTEPESIDKNYYPALIKKSDPIEDDVVVRARGLPWQATDCDIQRFFRGLNIAPGGIALVLSRVGRRNGEALIRFINSEHRDLALKKHKHHMNQRYIEVYMATGRDFSAVAGGETEEAEAFLKQMGDTSQTLVRMRGLPYTATSEQILEFFDSADCVVQNGVNGVLFVNHKDGRATGDAFVLFENEKMAEKALLNHRQHIGTRYIELFKSTPAEVNQVMNSMQQTAVNTANLGTGASGTTHLPLTSVPNAVLTATTPNQLLSMFPFQSLLEMEAMTIMQLQQSQLAAAGVHPHHGGPAGHGPHHAASAQQSASAAAVAHQFAVLSAMGILPPTSATSTMNLLNPSTGLSELAGSTSGGTGPALGSVANLILTHVGYASPRCFIHIRGMPVDASVADILSFLGPHSHNIVYQGVHMVFDASGQPAGEAMIQMVNEVAASAVVEQKNKTFFYLSSNSPATAPGGTTGGSTPSGSAGSGSSASGSTTGTTVNVNKRSQVDVTFCTTAEASQFALTASSGATTASGASAAITPLMLTNAGPPMAPATMAAFPTSSSSGIGPSAGGATPSPLMMLPIHGQMGPNGAAALNYSLLAAAAQQQQVQQQQQQHNAAAAAMFALQSQQQQQSAQSRHAPSSATTALYPTATGASQAGATTVFFPAGTAAAYPGGGAWPGTLSALMPQPNPAAALYFTNAAALAAASGHSSANASAFFPPGYAAAVAAVAAVAGPNLLPNVVIAKGLPKDVTQEELFSLFEGVLMPGMLPDVSLCYSSDGCPTGEAVITFHTQAEAERASRECNRRYIRNQFVEVLWPHATFLGAS